MKTECDYHVPVLGQEVMSFLHPTPGKVFFDGTLGGGGHTRMLLEAGARVIATDQDSEAIHHAEKKLESFRDRLSIYEINFADAEHALEAAGVDKLDGALLDIGVSSHQFDTGARGFSFRFDGPLDMRMSDKLEMTAADIVNTYSIHDMAQVFLDLGEEHRAVQIASRIAVVRATRPLKTTFDLLAAIEPILPHHHHHRHPATKVFQALRIAVNDELNVLTRGLEVLSRHLAPGARIAVITFHSLEDRIVKLYFKDRSREWLDRPEWPAPRRNPECIFHLLTSKPIEADEEEIHENPRCRSAKLRVAERRNTP
ncbi:MAG: 16S rRNA (cytosine(1402)-N(4))-methyltransferase RsmH [Chthoniobacterales bacterium]